MLTRRSILTGGAILFASPALPHSWYDPWCCNAKDCAPIPASAVRVTPGGFAVTLQPGEHPMVTEGVFRAFVRHRDARPSEDGEYHACIYPADTMRCFYAAQGGV